MPPVAAAITAIGTSLTSAALAGGAAIGLSAGTVFAGIGIFQQLAAGVALSALSRALAPKAPGGPKPVSGMKVQATSGEDQSLSFIFGRYATYGDYVYRNSHGNEFDVPNCFYTQVIELADAPVDLLRVNVNGEWAALGKTAHPDYGYPIKKYETKRGNDTLWIKFYNGKQTIADPGLIEAYPDSDENDKPWTSTMVGRGIAYAIVTTRFKPEIHRQVPKVLFELQASHYDPRKDSSNGGSGAQRFSNRATWKPSNNLAVHIYNVMRGIHDPITGDFIWGGQGFLSRDLTRADWFAAMNECDRLINHTGGSAAQYHGGLEVRVSDEPSSVIEEFLKGCDGMISEIAGSWSMRAGPPLLAVFGFTDDDIIITESDTFDPFPGVDKAYNGASATYPEPNLGWEMKDAPIRLIDAYLVEDQNRLRVADLSFTAVWNYRQVQRLMASGLKDQRRFRRHTLVLPPEVRKLGPLDEISWNSERNGYSNKLFSIDAIEDLPNGNCAVMLRERDPSDYDWSTDMELPTAIDPTGRDLVVPLVGSFGVEPATIEDTLGNPRRPAIRLFWQETSNVTAVRYRVRLTANHQHVPVSSAGSGGDSVEVSSVLTIDGDNLTFGGDTLDFVTFDDEDALQVFIIGVLPATAYQVQAIFVPTSGRVWSEWMDVTTDDIRLGEIDLEDEVRDRIQQALDDAAAAAAAVALISAHVDELDALLSGLSEETLDRIDALVLALETFDAEAIAELTGIAVAGTIKGWATDPTFRNWSSGALDNWTDIGTTSYAVRDVNGTVSSTAIPPKYLSSLWANVPTGTAALNFSVTSDIAGEIPGADFAAEYLVASVLLYIPGGNPIGAGSRIRIEWWDGSQWIRGHAFGANNALGSFDQWGFEVSATRRQSKEVVWKRPVASPTKVRLVMHVKLSTSSGAVQMRVDYLDLRAATNAEIAAHLSNSYTDTEISELEFEITGPSGAIAAAMNTVRAEFATADASITNSVVAVATDIEALAGQVNSIEVGFNSGNLVRNPRFADGVRPSGEDPNYWDLWPTQMRVAAKTIAPAGTAGQQNSPTPFFGVVDSDGSQIQARAVHNAEVKPGDILSFQYMSSSAGVSINFQIQFQVSWFTAAGAGIGSSVAVANTIQTGTAWKKNYGELTAPAGAAFMDAYIRVVTGGSINDAFFTNVEVKFVDGAARALISTASAAAATANSALATQNTTVSAEFGSYSAFVSAAATALATADMAASALVFRVIGGQIGLYGWNDETGLGAAFKVDARNLIAAGTVSAQELVISDTGFNIVPDNQLQSDSAWSDTGVGSWDVIPDSTGANTVSIGEIRWNPPASNTGDPAVSRSKVFPVRAGQSFYGSAQARRIDGTKMDVTARIRFADRNGESTGFPVILSYSGTNTTNVSDSAVVTAPAGTTQAQWEWIVWRDGGTNSAVRFFGPRLQQREPGSTLITPNSITATQANFVDLASLGLKVVRADIVDAAVDTLQIRGNAVTVPIYAERNTGLTSTESYETVLSVNVPLDFSGTIVVMGVMQVDGVSAPFEATSGNSPDIRILVNGSTSVEFLNVGSYTQYPFIAGENVGAGNHTVSVQFRHRGPFLGSKARQRKTAIVILGAMR